MTEEERRKEADRQADRVLAMLDAALTAVREGKGDDAVMLVAEGLKTLKAIPKEESRK